MEFIEIGNFPEILTFDVVGAEALFVVDEIVEGKTEYGEAEFVYVTLDTGEKRAFIVSAGLRYYNWEEFKGKTIKMVYEGLVRNPNTNNKFKKYKIFVGQVENLGHINS